MLAIPLMPDYLLMTVCCLKQLTAYKTASYFSRILMLLKFWRRPGRWVSMLPSLRSCTSCQARRSVLYRQHTICMDITWRRKMPASTLASLWTKIWTGTSMLTAWSWKEIGLWASFDGTLNRSCTTPGKSSCIYHNCKTSSGICIYSLGPLSTKAHQSRRASATESSSLCVQ